jgi:hypothetical protein
VTNIGSVRITNVYNKNVINSTVIIKASFNGGPAGTRARPTAEEQAAAHEKHIPATDVQSQHQQAAGANRASFASVNKGHPSIAATATAGLLAGAGVVAAKGAIAANRSSGGAAVNHRGEVATDPPGLRRLGNLTPAGEGQRYKRQATTPKGFGQQPGNPPPHAAGQRYTHQTMLQRGYGRQPPPRQGAGQARRVDQHANGKKPDKR